MRDMDIDAVVTWVDGSDPILQAKQAFYFKRDLGSNNGSNTRFASCDEILYCVGSLLRFAPFLRKIHIVTDAQTPDIYETLTQVFGVEAVAKIEIVDHTAIFAGFEEYLPIFNSTGIETMLHRIPGLAEQFITLNDDFFLVRLTHPEDYFRNGKPVLRGHYKLNLKQGWRRWRKLRQAKRHPEMMDLIVASHKETQLHASKIAGRRFRTFEIDHNPRPQRRSIFEKFAEKQPEMIRENIRHRLRHWAQFNEAALSAALEIQLGNRFLEGRSLVYIHAQGRRSTRAYLYRKLAEIDRKKVRFLCIQSLDQAEASLREILIAWLDDRILRRAPLASTAE